MNKVLLEIASFVLDVPADSLGPATSAMTCANWTHARLLTMISNFEIEFGVEKFTQKEIERIKSLEDLELILISKKAFTDKVVSEAKKPVLNENDLIRMIAQTLFIDPVSITSATQKKKIPEWDSMGIISIMAMLEDEFQLTLSVEEAVALNGMPDLIAVLRKHNKLA
jgi:acyl carrier protein